MPTPEPVRRDSNSSEPLLPRTTSSQPPSTDTKPRRSSAASPCLVVDDFSGPSLRRWRENGLIEGLASPIPDKEKSVLDMVARKICDPAKSPIAIMSPGTKKELTEECRTWIASHKNLTEEEAALLQARIENALVTMQRISGQETLHLYISTGFRPGDMAWHRISYIDREHPQQLVVAFGCEDTARVIRSINVDEEKFAEFARYTRNKLHLLDVATSGNPEAFEAFSQREPELMQILTGEVDPDFLKDPKNQVSDLHSGHSFLLRVSGRGCDGTMVRAPLGYRENPGLRIRVVG